MVSYPCGPPWRLDTEVRHVRHSRLCPWIRLAYGDRAHSRSTFTPGSVPRPMPTVPTAKRAHWRQPPDRPFPDPQTRATQSAATARAAQAKQHTPTFDTRHGEACPSLLGKDPALMLWADTTAPVVNDEEKLARATTQAHKAARDGYRFDVGTFAIWAGCDRATTLVAGAQHVGVLRLLFARWLRLRTKWRDVMDQLRVVLVHAPDVSARTAIVRESRVLARERQIFGGILPTRRTGRSVEQLIVSRTERTSSPTSDLRHVARRQDSFVSRSRGNRSLSSSRRH